MEENSQIEELLKQIEKTNRKQTRMGVLLCVFALVTAACCVLSVVLICSALPQVNAVVTQMQTVLGNLEQTTEQLEQADLQSMVTDVDTLVRTGQQSLEQTMEKLNAIDIETLNQAIEDLAAVVKPLADFFNVFNRS